MNETPHSYALAPPVTPNSTSQLVLRWARRRGAGWWTWQTLIDDFPTIPADTLRAAIRHHVRQERFYQRTREPMEPGVRARSEYRAMGVV